MRAFAFLNAGFLVGLLTLANVATASAQQPVTVFAAASLTDALNAIAPKFTDATKIPVRFSFAASSALAKQIEQGAPADLFASADLDWMDYLQTRALIEPATRTDLLGNDLVLIAPKDAPAASVPLTVDGLKAALAGGKLTTGTVESVPVGRYAKIALTKLGLWASVEPSLAQADSVRAALALVGRGEATLGIVYGTDAKADARVKVVATFPADSHPRVVYPFALTKAASGDAPAKFLAFLKSPEAAAVFAGQGFTRPAIKPATN